MKKAAIRLISIYGLSTLIYFGLSKLHFELTCSKNGLVKSLEGIFFWGERYVLYFLAVIASTLIGMTWASRKHIDHYGRIFAYILGFYTFLMTGLFLINQ